MKDTILSILGVLIILTGLYQIMQPVNAVTMYQDVRFLKVLVIIYIGYLMCTKEDN